MVMKNEMQSICVVDYETESSLIHEYMSMNDFQELRQSEKNGNVRIMGHLQLDMTKKA